MYSCVDVFLPDIVRVLDLGSIINFVQAVFPFISWNSLAVSYITNHKPIEFCSLLRFLDKRINGKIDIWTNMRFDLCYIQLFSVK